LNTHHWQVKAIAMDRTKFSERSPGKLVPIVTDHGRDWAFIPHELPPSWTFDPALWPRLVTAKEALGTLNGIGQVLPDPSLLLIPLQYREAITSSSIEGTFVTAEQLLLFELKPDEPTNPRDPSADWQEVHNYSRALDVGIQMLKTMPLCNRVIRDMHKVLMHGVRGHDKRPGEFRKYQVQIGSKGKFIPPPPNEVEPLMQNLERFIHQEDDLDPLVKGFLLHYQFEAIHPFLDGNGRIGRAILALLISQWHGHAAPWLYMSAYFEKYKDEYMEGLYRISAEGSWSEWLDFCLRGVIEQARDSIRRCHQLNLLKRDYHLRVKTKSARTDDLIASLFSSPVLQIPWVQRRYSISYPTARDDVQTLVDAGILSLLKTHRPKTYCAQEILQIAYREPGATPPGESTSATQMPK